MVGYGPEANHFVIELTYNYPVKSYIKGNDFIGITIQSKEVLERAKKYNWPILNENVLEAPGGYKFFILNEPQPDDKGKYIYRLNKMNKTKYFSDPIVKVQLASSNLQKSLKYWNGILNLKIFKQSDKSALLGYDENEAKLELVDIGKPLDRATAYGRIAFSCPRDLQPIIDEKIKNNGEKILTPLISLDTPGKATVTVIILADPDGHEICFVDDEAFRELSQVDPQGDILLERYIKKDPTEKNEWIYMF